MKTYFKAFLIFAFLNIDTTILTMQEWSKNSDYQHKLFEEVSQQLDNWVKNFTENTFNSTLSFISIVKDSIRDGDSQILKLLVSSGIIPKNEELNLSLYFAIEFLLVYDPDFNNTQAIEILLNNGANPDAIISIKNESSRNLARNIWFTKFDELAKKHYV